MMAHACYDKKRKCPICGKEYWASRRDSIYCSPKCRTRAHRKESPRETLKALHKTAHDNINGIVGFSGDSDVALAYQAQRHLYALVLLSLEYMDDNHRKKVYDQLRDIVVTFSGNGYDQSKAD